MLCGQGTQEVPRPALGQSSALSGQWEKSESLGEKENNIIIFRNFTSGQETGKLRQNMCFMMEA